MVNKGDTAWMLVSSALVLLMTPGLAFFYGGMVRRKGVLNMIMMSFIAIPVVTVTWVIAGYSLAFGHDIGGLVGIIHQSALGDFQLDLTETFVGSEAPKQVGCTPR